MKKIVLLLTSVLVLSCNDNQPPIYDGVNGQTLVYFENSTSNLPIEIDADGSVTIPINASTISTVDRTVTVELVTDDSTADPQNYSFSPTVVIPAGSYTGNLVVNGTDVTAETDIELLVFKIKDFSDAKASKSSLNHQVSVFQFCPIPEDKFVGNYLIEETTPFVDGPTLSHNTVVNVQRISETERKFSTRNYPNYCTPFRDFFFNLVCNNVVVLDDQQSTCNCTAAGLFFGPATTASIYDVNDDSVFFLTFTNDKTADCGTTVQTTYKFTKQ
jgi:hypothetical protein